ncbi:hypothetical protein Misp02_34740 [Microtetraspora sp. NBRC 16547]|nr:hypothetical protein Misp02_34740 [Microtetraspora sp. NBRC 16547]
MVIDERKDCQGKSARAATIAPIGPDRLPHRPAGPTLDLFTWRIQAGHRRLREDRMAPLPTPTVRAACLPTFRAQGGGTIVAAGGPHTSTPADVDLIRQPL